MALTVRVTNKLGFRADYLDDEVFGPYASERMIKI